ncbi:MAG: non-heme iron oxygenase ferredoxin subunit [Rhodospirillum sp.]|nr:non-heme iron oxygenase ferredoxin subunit [Rhodospirillum sp.]MCF8489490.1 non-heme iron oxygenase ferredoxin subunit [Rhodospirillum sp.]
MAWQPVANEADVIEGEVLGTNAGNTPVALYRVDSEILATHDICTHAYARLSDGYLEDGQIECPLHQALFDVRTGAVVSGPTQCALAVFPVRVEDGRVLIDV